MRRFSPVFCISLVLLPSRIFGQLSIDLLSKNVVFLREQVRTTEILGGKEVEIWYRELGSNEFKPKLSTKSGTGFIVNHKGRDYLVTAKHITSSITKNSEIIMNLGKGKSIQIKFGTLASLSIIQDAKWFAHHSADIAIHPLAYPEKPDQVSISSNYILRDLNDIELLATVYVLGFPMNLGVKGYLSPISKKAQIASGLTSIDYPGINPNLEYVLLDQALAQGYSGAPVFYVEEIDVGPKVGNYPGSSEERIHLIGLLSGNLSDGTGGKISLVVPIFYLWDIFYSAEFVEYQKNLK